MASEEVSPTDSTKSDLLAISFEQLSLNESNKAAPELCPPWAKSQVYAANSTAKKGFTPRRSLQSTSSTRSLPVTPILLRKASVSSIQSIAPSNPNLARRKSSTQFTNSSALVGKLPLENMTPRTPRTPRHTPASIASNQFKAELELHGKHGDTLHTETIVILHDSCYGHRFSRPRTSKATLDMIVERPERIHASILGLSIAYVRLGGRYAGGQHPPCTKDPIDIPSVPFQVLRTTRRLELSSQIVTNVHGSKWMEELKMMCDSADSKLAANGNELVRPKIKRGTSQDAPEKLHEGDLYLCSESLNAMEGSLGAVCDGVDAVFRENICRERPSRAFVAIRPPGHHCSASHPSGFCWVNNVHVGISYAASQYGLTHAAIIDFDLHHGDGSQSIAWENNRRAINATKNSPAWKKVNIGYFSLHDINSYPCEMGDENKVKNASLCIDNAHGQSIWNVHLQPWKNEADFWALYESKYSIILEKARNFLCSQTQRLRLSGNGTKPKGAIFISAGFDASEWESPGMQRHKVNVPTEFYARFTNDIIKLAEESETSVNGRIISVLEGGYSDHALCSGVLSHIIGMANINPVTVTQPADPNSTSLDLKANENNIVIDNNSTASPVPQTYNPDWWSRSCLEELDMLKISPLAAPEIGKPRDVTSSFSSPTQSFISKVTAQASRHTISVMSNLGNRSPRQTPRAPSPPPPEVNWAVAAYELSKLLIPTERQTRSCRPEELSIEAARRRANRIINDLPPTTMHNTDLKPGEPMGRMALRTRKPTKVVEAAGKNDSKRKVTKSSGV